MVLVEGGSEVNGSFVDANLVDRVYLFQAPLIMGGREAKSSVGGEGFSSPQRSLHLRLLAKKRLGKDHLFVYSSEGN